MHGTYNIKITTTSLGHSLKNDQNKVVHLPDEFKLTVKQYIQASLYMLHCDTLTTALFWFIMQRVVVISYQHFGKTYQSHLQGSRIQKKAFCPNTKFI
jgi:hypothetical protein